VFHDSKAIEPVGRGSAHDFKIKEVQADSGEVNLPTDITLIPPEQQLCAVAPSPEALERLQAQLEEAREGVGSELAHLLRVIEPTAVGMNDGLIIPPSYFPVGTPADVIRSTAADRAPLRGTVRVIVVLVDFSDRQFDTAHSQQHFRDLFFSTGVIPTGSVKEYYREVTNNLVDIAGDVVGPYRMPHPITYYANGRSGRSLTSPNSRDLARDGNGFVDAFIVVHAGRGAEETLNTDDLWSVKWVLAGGAYTADNTQIYAFLTVPEDAKTGVCAHELGHLLFGFPDLYDVDDGASEGIGNWCLMASGSWGGGGDTPCHPSAWCKVQQGWASVVTPTTNANVSITEVKDSQTIYRLWKDGTGGSEYFLLENRQRNRFDVSLPGEGLLVWHVDDTVADNNNPNRYKVALMQADGQRDLERGANRGNSGDPYPGSNNNTSFTVNSNPNSKSYTGGDTCVGITNIPSAGPAMPVRLSVRCVPKSKEAGLGKEIIKDVKDRTKESRQDKSMLAKEFRVEKLELEKRATIDKRPDKGQGWDKRVGLDKPWEKLTEGRPWDAPIERPSQTERSLEEVLAALEDRMSALEARIAAGETEEAKPFIGAELRPDLSQGALLSEEDVDEIHKQMEEGLAPAKRYYDSKQPEA
jgi:immune inhibitor A